MKLTVVYIRLSPFHSCLKLILTCFLFLYIVVLNSNFGLCGKWRCGRWAEAAFGRRELNYWSTWKCRKRRTIRESQNTKNQTQSSQKWQTFSHFQDAPYKCERFLGLSAVWTLRKKKEEKDDFIFFVKIERNKLKEKETFFFVCVLMKGNQLWNRCLLYLKEL